MKMRRFAHPIPVRTTTPTRDPCRRPPRESPISFSDLTVATPSGQVLPTPKRASGGESPDTHGLVESLDRLFASVLEVVLLADHQLPDTI